MLLTRTVIVPQPYEYSNAELQDDSIKARVPFPPQSDNQRPVRWKYKLESIPWKIPAFGSFTLRFISNHSQASPCLNRNIKSAFLLMRMRLPFRSKYEFLPSWLPNRNGENAACLVLLVFCIEHLSWLRKPEASIFPRCRSLSL